MTKNNWVYYLFVKNCLFCKSKKVATFLLQCNKKSVKNNKFINQYHQLFLFFWLCYFWQYFVAAPADDIDPGIILIKVNCCWAAIEGLVFPCFAWDAVFGCWFCSCFFLFSFAAAVAAIVLADAVDSPFLS